MSDGGELPDGWARVSLGDLCESTFYGPRFGADAYVADGIPTIRTTDMNARGEIVFRDPPRVRVSAEELDRFGLRDGDVLVTRSGSIGRCAAYEGSLGPALPSAYLIRVRLRDGLVLPRYALARLLSPAGRDHLGASATAVTQSNVNATAIAALDVPLPPLAEQKRIVAKLEDLLARSRHAKEALDAIPPLELSAVRYWTSPRWPSRRLGDVLERADERAGARWRAFPTVGLSNEGEIVDRREKIGAKTAEKCVVVRPGDVVFNPIRFSIGSIARYRGGVPAIMSPEYVVFRTTGELSAELLVRLLRSTAGRALLETETTGSVRYRVYFKDLAELRLPIAPPTDQRNAESFFAALSSIAATNAEIRARLGVMEQALLAKAFRGELVPQDPNDEPAEVLLARLKAATGVAEQAGAKKIAKRRASRA